MGVAALKVGVVMEWWVLALKQSGCVTIVKVGVIMSIKLGSVIKIDASKWAWSST